MDEFTGEEIADMLARTRPDRYDRGDLSWAEAIIELVAERLDGRSARIRTAEQIVRGSEKGATRRTNAFMRDVVDTGTLPLDWMDRASWPLSVAETRVCLRALTSSDLRQFADIEESSAEKDYASRIAAVKGARQLADLLDEHRCPQVRDLGAMQVHS